MFLLYSLLYSLGVILTAPYYFWRTWGKTSVRWRERIGFLPPWLQPVNSGEPGAIWVHAVSVGETLAVVALVRGLEQQYPGRKIFLSHVTPAGREAGEKRLPQVAGRFFLPLDWSWSVRRVLAQVRPALLVIVETELWPNLLREAGRFGTRVLLVNARLSDRSFRGYRLARLLMRRLLEPIGWVCAQTEQDAERFRRLGARAERVAVTGNLKFDAEPPHCAAMTELASTLRGAKRAPLLVAASTMPGEEALLLPTWNEIRRRHARAILLLAPRHPARFEEVAELLARQGKSFLRRTGIERDGQRLLRQLASPEILLLDTIGELAGMFELADLVFMGGSLVPAGGHNLLEPAFWSRPILFGPHMENFRDIAQLFLEAGAAVRVRDSRDLARRVLELLDDEARCRLLGQRAKHVLEQASGATERVLGHVRELLEADVAVRAGA
jgi:3-deoxy-D-manno-octulosonic-acid transferase